MALDMDQLRKMFYEECRENLEVLEEVLLELDPTSVDIEIINTIFRAAHSIKGGAATFNLFDISEFTHSVEAYLDLVRNAELHLTKESVDVLLRSCDCIKNMLEGHESNLAVDEDFKASVNVELKLLLERPGTANETPPESWPQQTESEALESNDDSADIPWSVSFVPHSEIFFSGNDPLRIIREVRELDANAVIQCDTPELPDLNEIEPELCYLSWSFTLAANIDEQDIIEIFEWVEDECDLTIQKKTDTVPMESTLEDVDQSSGAVTDASENSGQENSNPSTQTKTQVQQGTSSSESQPPATISNAAASNKPAKTDSGVSSIRVDIDKVDGLINLVGELVITQSMLTEIGNDFSVDKLEKLKAGLDQLLQNSKDLQENVLNIRMLPMSFAFSRFPRLVRDLCGRLEKEVDLQIVGENTELDKTVLERIVDPLVHLVRNGIDHGIELPEQRVQSGKPEMGVIRLDAFHQGGSIVIEVEDDGAGINCDVLWEKAVKKGVISADSRREEMTDKQIVNLIFAPGFSTADEVSDISGRGVGMDVVKRNIEELGGHIEVESKFGKGSKFTISLPLTLAILDGQLVRVSGEVYIIPLLTIIESIQIDTNCVKHAAGGVELYRLRDENIPILRLQDEFKMGESGELQDRILCFVEAAGNRVGLLIDELLDQQQVVIKSLESNYSKVAGISGATILGDGSVSLILDIQGLITSFLDKNADSGVKKGIAA
ncbi:chemotaxis protein CheA [Vibrio makurazakiensis]|uniref:chemotaxis protein CheA n=1 Tax=Vibrio makurazakiensis TaxID=2910250 RepID=UPI003D0CA2DA